MYLDVNLKSSPSGLGGSLSLHAGQEYRVDFAEYVQAFTLICCLVTDIAFSLGHQEVQDHCAMRPMVILSGVPSTMPMVHSL